MISKNMEKALNEQINAEMYSAYLYLSMESYFRSLDLSGFANWMRVQVQEEMMHAMKMMKDAPCGMFMLDRELGQRVFTPPTTGGQE